MTVRDKDQPLGDTEVGLEDRSSTKATSGWAWWRAPPACIKFARPVQI